MEINEIKQRLTMAMVLIRYNLKPDKRLRLCCPFIRRTMFCNAGAAQRLY